MPALPRIAALFWSLSAVTAPALAGSWSAEDLHKAAEAALDAAPLAEYPSLRIDGLLKLGDALAQAGDMPAAHAAVAAAAAMAQNDRQLDWYKLRIVEWLARRGFVADATQLASSAGDPRLAEKLAAAIDNARTGKGEAAQPPRQRAAVEQYAADLAAARNFLGDGKMEEARAAALRASRAALGQAMPDRSSVQYFEHGALLGHISEVLCQVGEYDQAIATVQPIENVNRQQYYVFAIEAAVRAHDDAAVKHLLPIVIAAVAAPTANWATVQKLHRTVRSLALGGYRDAAQTAFAALIAVYDRLTGPGRLPPVPTIIAECQALTGDLAAALETADKAGPLVGPPGRGLAVMSTVLAFGGAKSPPTPEQLKAQLARAQAMQPAQVPGAKAAALAQIAADLAGMHEIDAAIGVEAALEVEPRDVLAVSRDHALAPISRAQQESGDDEASLATALRISRRDARFERLLKLAAVAPRP